MFDGYLSLEGFAYRLSAELVDSVDCEGGYENVMQRLGWRDMSRCHIDEISCRFLEQYWEDVLLLAMNLKDRGEDEKAMEVLDKTLKEVPMNRIQKASIGAKLVSLYATLGAENRAKLLKEELQERLKEELRYYYTVNPKRQGYIAYEIKPREEALELIEKINL